MFVDRQSLQFKMNAFYVKEIILYIYNYVLICKKDQSLNDYN